MTNYRLTAIALCTVFLSAAHVRAQTAKPLQWDVISVKPISPDGCPTNSGGVGWLKGGITASCVPAAFVVQCAYRLMDQTRIVGLPDWTKSNSQLFTIEARVSGEDAAAYAKLTHDEQFRMLQQVLAIRFQMKAHMETRPMRAYDLTVAKGGPKLKQAPADEPSQSQFGARTGDVKWANSPLTNLTFLLGRETGRPVIDKTGLTGRYDFTLEYLPAARAAAATSDRPSVFTALEEQIGLRLVPSKEPVDVLVIDSIQQPSAN